MEIRQLRALCTIAETGNFRESSKQLCLTQPALSHQIRNLEQELGETLLVRKKPNITATPAGEFVINIANQILTDANTILEKFPKATHAPVPGKLRVAATNLGFTHLFGDLCEAFIRKHPLIELDFNATESPEEAVKAVTAGAADVAFGPVPRTSSHINTIELGTSEHVFIVSSDHALCGRKDVSLEELGEWPFIRFSPGAGSRVMSDKVFEKCKGYPPIVAESNDTEFIKRVASMGLGIAMVPVFALHRCLLTPKLHVFRLTGSMVTVKFGLTFRNNTSRQPLELLKKMCLEMRGDQLAHIVYENADDDPFPKAEIISSGKTTS